MTTGCGVPRDLAEPGVPELQAAGRDIARTRFRAGCLPRPLTV